MKDKTADLNTYIEAFHAAQKDAIVQALAKRDLYLSDESLLLFQGDEVYIYLPSFLADAEPKWLQILPEK
jgi:hypothetical protein